MPRFEPFAGIRYATDDLAAVTSPPYDVINADERAESRSRSTRQNVVLIDMPTDPEATPASLDAYSAPLASLAQWRSEGVLDHPTPRRCTRTGCRSTDEAGNRTTRPSAYWAHSASTPRHGPTVCRTSTPPRRHDSDRVALLRSDAREDLRDLGTVADEWDSTGLIDLDAAEPLGPLGRPGRRHP